MDNLHTINGKPVDATATVAPTVSVTDPTVTAAAAKDVHRPESGQVGLTGEHGKLGTNAK